MWISIGYLWLAQIPLCWGLSLLPALGATGIWIGLAIGGLTGMFLGALSTDVQMHDTYFVVAHFHYVMFGGALIAFVGGLHYWWPKITGRMYSEFWGRLACLLIFSSFNLTFFPQFLLGTRGNPRRTYNYLERFQSLHVVSTIGSYLLAAGFLIVAAMIAVGYGLCHLAGLREDVPYALGTANGGAWPRAAGVIYALLRLAFVILVPILVLAAALFAAASKRLGRVTSPQSL
jgi:heme/copper-type cytochrome/quinol oxidase subunit 1